MNKVKKCYSYVSPLGFPFKFNSLDQLRIRINMDYPNLPKILTNGMMYMYFGNKIKNPDPKIKAVLDEVIISERPHTSCAHCGKILYDDSKAYTIPTSSGIFCSKDCIAEYFCNSILEADMSKVLNSDME